jgi:Zn-dependent protease
MLVWFLVVFVSVLFHEFGHAITALMFGQKPKIALIAMGGVTTYEEKNLKFWKQFLIVLNGPLAGILLFLLSALILSFGFIKNPILLSFFQIMQLVNFFWSIINLLPVLPLDGGQLLRIALEWIFGIKGFRLSLLLGMVIALCFSVFFFIKEDFFIGAIFFLFAYQSFDMWRKAKFLDPVDRNVDVANLLREGEIALSKEEKEKAFEIFEKVRNLTKKGLLYATATHYLAILNFEKGEKHKAYEFLLDIKEEISDDAKCLLHNLAFEEKNYPLVAEYSALCYQVNPSLDVALKNARSFAFLKQAKPSGGWMQTAAQYEGFNLEKTLEEEVFTNVKEDHEFKHFIELCKK